MVLSSNTVDYKSPKRKLVQKIFWKAENQVKFIAPESWPKGWNFSLFFYNAIF